MHTTRVPSTLPDEQLSSSTLLPPKTTFSNKTPQSVAHDLEVSKSSGTQGKSSLPGLGKFQTKAAGVSLPWTRPLSTAVNKSWG